MDDKSIEYLHHIAEERHFECLSEKYHNTNTNYKWKCKVCGYIWKDKIFVVKQNIGCPLCSKKSLKLEIVQMIAKENNGECLSTVYTENEMMWKCSKGHKWHKKPISIKRGVWCPYCKKNKKIKDLNAIANKRGGKCLSTQYKGNDKKLVWECKEGHIWRARPRSIVNSKSWCPYCFGNIPYTIEDMRNFAKTKDGKCLSDTYVNNRRKLMWKCKEGHIWEATPKHILNTETWCPICKQSKGEEKCRKLFEYIFDKPFPKSFPNWLKNSEGYQLELDGYNTELKIAFEFQGKQHYKRVKFFHRSLDDFLKQKQNDNEKRIICNEIGIILIEIPYTIINRLENFVIRRLKDCGVCVSI